MSTIKRYINRIKDGTLKDILAQMKWLLQLSLKHKTAIIIYTVMGFSSAIVTLFSSFVSRDMVDIITGKQTGKLVTTFILMIIAAILGFSFSQLTVLLSRKVSLKIENTLKADSYDLIMSSDWESLSHYHSGELMMRWSSDCSIIASSVLSYFPNIIISLFKMISALYIVLVNDPSFVIFALMGIPLSLLVSRTNMKRLAKSNMSSMNINSKMSSFTSESFMNLQTVKAFDMLPFYSKRLRLLQNELATATMKYQKVTVLNVIALNLVSLLISNSAYGWGIYRVWVGGITYGSMTMFLSLSSQLTSNLQVLFTYVPTTVTLTNSIKRLRQLSDLPKEDFSQRDEVKEYFEAHKNEGVGLCVRNVAYTYATGTEVFQNACFEAHPHEAIALVGPSGGGKTTMLRLLLALIRGQEGQGYITYGNNTPESSEDSKPLTASCRQLFAYVPQGNTMFSGTIAENMRNVKEDATDEEIIEALKIACAWDFVEKLPDGINTMLQERGGGLSEGQAQRLSIARAVVRKSPILLLDEATSALDIETEHRLLRNIINDDYPRTTIVTTHRPSVLNSCHRIYSIENKTCHELSKEEVEHLFNEFING